MIRTLEQFNNAYRRLKESPRGEWFTHKYFPLEKWDSWSRAHLETEIARFAKRDIRFHTEEEEAQEKELGKAKNEKDLIAALLRDLGLLSPNFPEEYTDE